MVCHTFQEGISHETHVPKLIDLNDPFSKAILGIVIHQQSGLVYTVVMDNSNSWLWEALLVTLFKGVFGLAINWKSKRSSDWAREKLAVRTCYATTPENPWTHLGTVNWRPSRGSTIC